MNLEYENVSFEISYKKQLNFFMIFIFFLDAPVCVCVCVCVCVRACVRACLRVCVYMCEYK